MENILKLCLVVGMAALAGCATKPKKGTEQSDHSRMSSPSIQAVPVTPVEAPRVARISQDPIPVYQPARVREVRMDAYINERGEAFPPSVKYVVDNPGGWNMDALRNPQQAYVPPSSALQVPTAPGTQYTNIIQSSSEPAGPKQAGRFLYDLKDVKITGFTEMSQESRARATAGPNDATIYDESLGWVLVPKSVIRASGRAVTNIQQAPTPKRETQRDIGVDEKKASDFDILNNTPNTSAPSNRSSLQTLELKGELD